MEKKQKSQLFKDANNTWNQIDCLLYTPSLITGISFDQIDYFDSIYMYVCYDSIGSLEIL